MTRVSGETEDLRAACMALWSATRATSSVSCDVPRASWARANTVQVPAIRCAEAGQVEAPLPRLAAARAPRLPQETSLFQLVQAHLADSLAHAREAYEAPLPRYVIQEFHKYLACADVAQGFVHIRCDHCGYDLPVAFFCTVRGVCPSCAGCRMVGTAVHLVECVLPAVPSRQYVLAVPYELLGLDATRPAVLTVLSRIFWETIQLRYRRWLRSTGVLVPVEAGAMTGVHPAGASLNVHVDPFGRVTTTFSRCMASARKWCRRPIARRWRSASRGSRPTSRCPSPS